jgi:hypothetical protein
MSVNIPVLLFDVNMADGKQQDSEKTGTYILITILKLQVFPYQVGLVNWLPVLTPTIFVCYFLTRM